MLIFSVVEAVCFWPLKSIRPLNKPGYILLLLLLLASPISGYRCSVAPSLHVAELHLHISLFPLSFFLILFCISSAPISTEASTDVEITVNV